ncbi:MAG: alpha/beta hydrolase [Alphaproteobacteria bacterium]|nr:alpha/beta hydrolase [Alphaproteobacteria bacterium]
MDMQVNGRKVHAATGGRGFDPKQPTILMVHGASFDGTVWVLQTRYFAWHGRNVLALDLPGHGRTEGPLLGSIEAMADWLIAVLDAVEAKQAALCGHSMGALVTLACAARHPERVSALALLGAAAAIPVNDELLASAQAGEHLAMDLINSWGFGRRAQAGVHRVPGLWMMKGGLRILEASARDVLYTDLKACNDWKAGAGAAAAVRCPTQLVLGERDVMTPLKAGRELAAMIAGARVAVLPSIGHIMPIEAPDETLDVLKGFL